VFISNSHDSGMIVELCHGVLWTTCAPQNSTWNEDLAVTCKENVGGECDEFFFIWPIDSSSNDYSEFTHFQETPLH